MSIDFHMSNTTWLITGASSGLGYALGEYVLKQGDRVVLAARTLGSMAGLAKRFPETGLALALDVTKPVQRSAVVEQTETRFGGIDVLVNNAGIDFLGAIEEQNEDDYRALFEVNFFGARPFCVSSCQACVGASGEQSSTCRPWTAWPVCLRTATTRRVNSRWKA